MLALKKLKALLNSGGVAGIAFSLNKVKVDGSSPLKVRVVEEVSSVLNLCFVEVVHVQLPHERREVAVLEVQG